MPLYRSAREKITSSKLIAKDLLIPVGIHDYHAQIRQTTSPSGLPVYLLEKDEFFDRTYLYGTPDRGDYQDNAERFITFCRAVHSLCISLKWFPSIFHLHDWQTALAAVYHHMNWRYDPNFSRSATVFTIHNLAYQGIFPANHFDLTRLPPEVFSLRGMEFFGKCNFMKAGLSYANFLTTVSPRYSKEIQQEEFGCGLEGVLKERSQDLAGILNGIDTDTWNPSTDSSLPAQFSAEDLSGKKVCKNELLSEIGFGVAGDRPLLAMISRLATQKGFDLLTEILEDLLRLPLYMVILGTGDAVIENQLKIFAARHPDRLVILSRFDEALAHRIEAGADIFLMPSQYEPCGLNQLYSLRYGTVPVVHATGGLEDSVVDVLRYPEKGNGFKFDEYDAAAFMGAIEAAFEIYTKDSKRWRQIQLRGMRGEFSWDQSAGKYLKIYKAVLGKKSS
jgi:starch synthase